MTEAPIPSAALDDRLAFVGTTGSGKTYAAGTAVERLLASGARVVIVDPLDVWWGLRLAADGKTPSPFKLPIFGGAHGDLPLTEHAGGLLGETVATMAESCIVSLGGLPTKSAERRFMLAFLDAIYRKADPSKYGPFHIVFDEADLWAPQKASEPMLQSRMEEIVRRGRVKGFIPWLITQRPAVLSKDVLSQVDGMVAMKLTGSHDRDAIGAWIEGSADKTLGKALLAGLPAMQRGQGMLWIPARDVLAEVQFPAKATYDSSRTPKRGEVIQRRDLKALDLDALKGRLSAIEDETKANDPRALKAEVARLTRELAKAEKAKSSPPAPPPARVANEDEIEAARKEGERIGIAVGIARAQAALSALRVDQPLTGETPVQRAPTRPTAPLVPREPPETVTPTRGVSGPGQRILNALGWWSSFGINTPTNEQVAFIAGYSPTSTGYTNPRSALRTAGLIEYVPQGVTLTDAGREKAEAPTAPPSREELHRRVLGKLGGPQQRILTPLLAAHPEGMTNEEVATAAGYSVTSTGYTNPRSSLRTLSLIEYLPGSVVRAEDWLFP